jgi:molybdate transport system substrate-binding protein
MPEACLRLQWPRSRARHVLPLIAVLGALVAGARVGTAADEIHVLSSGATSPAYLQLVPLFEKQTGHKLITDAIATGVGPTAIPARIRRGEPGDVVLTAAATLDDLIKQGRVVADSRADLARSSIGMAVRAGANRPDISTVEALKRTLLDARSVAYSAQVSGLYLVNELFPRLGVADAVAKKSRRAETEPVGEIVARGEAEIGFQQISELRAVKGIDYVGPLPGDAQRTTVFAAGVLTASRHQDASRALIRFLRSPEAVRVMTQSGLEALASAR